MSTPGRTNTGAYRRSPGGVYMRREPVDYIEYPLTYLKVSFAPPNDPVNYIYRSNNALYPGTIYHYALQYMSIFNLRSWGLGKIINGEFSAKDLEWKLDFYASGGLHPGYRTLQDPMVTPTVTWNATEERVEIVFDTGWMTFLISDLMIGCLTNWYMPYWYVRNQDDELLLRFQSSRPGGPYFTCGGTTTYYIRFPALTLYVTTT